MSIHPANFAPISQTYTMLHDEEQHSFEITVSDLLEQNSELSDMLVIKCSMCDATSYHPIGGGSHPRQIQEMFVLLEYTKHQLAKDGITLDQTINEVHDRAEASEPGRWQVDPLRLKAIYSLPIGGEF